MKEKLKSVLIILMLLSAGALFYVSVTLDMDTKFSPIEGILTFFKKGSVQDNTEGVIKTPAALPQQLAVSQNGGLYIAADADSFDQLWQQASPVYAEALGSMGDVQAINEDTCRDYFEQSLLYISYHQAFPIYMLESWAGFQPAALDMTASVLIVAEKGGKVWVVFQDSVSGQWYQAPTAASKDRLADLAGGRKANGLFAYKDEAYQNFWTYSPVLLISSNQAAFQISDVSYANSTETVHSLLGSFSMNPYLAQVYQDNSGAIVYVDSYRSLRLSKDGSLAFSAQSGGGIPITISESAGQRYEQVQTVEQCRVFLANIWQLMGASGQLSLSSLSIETDTLTLSFELRVNNLFINENTVSAYLTVKDGKITQVILHPRRLDPSGQTAVLPYRLGAVAAARADLYPQVIYEEDAGTLIPKLCVSVRRAGGK